MVVESSPQTQAQRERLLYTLMLRQIEAQSSALRAAYGRLENAVAASKDASPDTLILDWLESELTRLKREAADAGDTGSQLLKQAVSLCSMLKT